jgi:hypothetical protein
MAEETEQLETEITEEEVAALARVRWPGTLLMIVGILNIYFAFALFRNGVRILRTPAMDVVRQASNEELAPLLDSFVKLGGNPLHFRNAVGFPLVGFALIALVAGYLIVYGGINLRELNYYRMALAGSVLAAVPPFSPLACCGIGEVVGLCCLFVAQSRQVRPMFRGQ